MELLVVLFIYFVSFLDKPEKSAPQLSPRAMEQRAKWSIPTDGMDYPVSPHYTDSLRRMGATIHHKSRWFNGVTCEMSEKLAGKVAQLSFVTEVEMTRDDSEPVYSRRKQERRNLIAHRAQSTEYMTQTGDLASDEQLEVYNLLPLHEAGFEGQGILMAVCDGGFYKADKLSCFRHDSLELGHFDFTDDKDGFYGWTGTHGTECLSAISGITDDYHGAATQAKYYLMRSEENATESPKEMDNLVAALEKADSLGVNVFSVSLGYAMFDNEEWNMDGSSLNGVVSRASRAATIAARKGMLVCTAIGNEGDNTWRTLSAPADADSILTVGAVDINRQIGDFSSYGPTSDGRVKPEVCAVGVWTALINPNGDVVHSNGTSFATPLIAGLAASLWSALPDENAMQIRERIIRSTEFYGNPDPDNHYGYGIPDAWKAYTMTLESIDSPQSATGSRKILRNGQIYILRGEKRYDILGRELGS